MQETRELATKKFTMRVSPEDRKVFAKLAKYLRRRSQSDAIRFVVSEFVKVFHAFEEKELKTQKRRKAN